MLNMVQKHGARYVLNEYSYVKGTTKLNLDKLGWTSLEEQRAKSKVLNLYKGLNKMIEIPVKENCHLKSNKHRTRQSGYQVFNIPSSNINCHLYSYFPSTIRLWNSLPTTIKMQGSVESFK